MPAQTVIKLRRDTAANWDSINPVLASGEMGVETDTGLHKFGNGSSAWGALPYAASSKIVQQVKNASGSTMAKGSVVYVSGATGGDALVTLADADSEMTSSKTLGLLATAIANDAYGNVIEQGLLSGVDTASATAGQSVWLSSTAGQFVFGNPPAKPAHSVYLGVVTRVHATEGEILVKVQNGYELNELHDVNAGSPSTNDVLQWNGTAWVNADVVTQVTAAIVDSAPATLDTLNELAAALGDDADFATTVTTALGTKQDKVSGVSDTEISYLGGAFPVTSSIQTQLNGKAGLTHFHEINQVAGLEDALAGKAATSHTHGMGDLTDFSISSPAVDQILKYDGTDWVNDPANKLGASVGELGVGASGPYTLTLGKSRAANSPTGVIIQSATDATSDNSGQISRSTGSQGQLTIFNSGGISIQAIANGGFTQLLVSPTGSITGNFGSLVSNNSNTSIALLSSRSVRGGILRCTASSAVTITIPTQAESTAASAQPWVIGDRIDILQAGTGQITFSPNAGVTLVSVDSKRKTNKQYSGATLICVATNTFHLIGDLAA